MATARHRHRRRVASSGVPCRQNATVATTVTAVFDGYQQDMYNYMDSVLGVAGSSREVAS
eukprot:6207639-Pleurochrysis_carterae.AAC.1